MITITGMTITNQDYINTVTIILLYAIVGWVLIGISALIVKHFDPLNRKIQQIQSVTAEQNKTRKVA